VTGTRLEQAKLRDTDFGFKFGGNVTCTALTTPNQVICNPFFLVSTPTSKLVKFSPLLNNVYVYLLKFTFITVLAKFLKEKFQL